jgi:hypothetical protein
MARPLIAFAAALIIACAHAEGTDQPSDQKVAVQQTQKPAAGAQAVAEFNERLKEYAELHNRLEDTLPKLPKEADPKIIDAHQRALEKLLKAERKNAKPGDILTPAVQAHVRQVLARVLAGKDGAQLKATIMDENPGNIGLTINSRYPDEVPLSTVPPQVLASLPKLPEELEYRFIGERLILLDIHSHTIADYMDNVFPG